MNFALILFALCIFTGIMWMLDRKIWAPARGLDAPRPFFLEYTAGFFPLLLAVFLFRSFLFEPFNIPSGSMIPTLRVGDMILVQKFSYGVRLPIVHTLVVPTGQPQRGDVVVFRYPKDESLDYIKRVVGLPGDMVVYENKQLTVNGKPVPKRPAGAFMAEGSRPSSRFQETLGDKTYFTLNDDGAPAFYFPEVFPHLENCARLTNGMRCIVPEGHYFMMGDNRDNSADSRIWGFVPERNLAGRAVVVWLNLSEVLSGRFDRLGSIQ